MHLTRRHFMMRSAAVAMGLGGLHVALARASLRQALPTLDASPAGFGPLVPDPDGLMDLPAGFRYRVISRQGETMTDGLLVPGRHDGMAAFPCLREDGTPDGRTVIVRNHEVHYAHDLPGPFGADAALLGRVDRARVYDLGHGKPCRGGTTTLVFDTRTQELEAHFLSLAGTQYNCAGGPTPWGTWISCEETTWKRSERHEQDHGWCFEVPATPTPGLAEPKPIRAMGRFVHEAVCIDPRTGFVYLTEDRDDGLLYRFRPDVPGELHAGGRLECLAVQGRPSLDTRNWEQDVVRPGQRFRVEWLPLDQVESPDDDLRFRGFRAGATRFARGEGIWWGAGSAYFACTTGGRIGAGQLWKLTPGETADALELFIEPNDRSVLENADNVTFAPWGDVVVCEDGKEPQHLLGVTPKGVVYKIGRNSGSKSELAGACFSPDGTTLFLNVQNEGLTLAITGPWDRVQR